MRVLDVRDRQGLGGVDKRGTHARRYVTGVGVLAVAVEHREDSIKLRQHVVRRLVQRELPVSNLGRDSLVQHKRQKAHRDAGLWSSSLVGWLDLAPENRLVCAVPVHQDEPHVLQVLRRIGQERVE